MSITQEDFDGCFDAVKSYVDGSFEEIETWVRELQGRLKELESRPAFKYCGTFSGDQEYNPGNFVTHSGSLWSCRQSTRTEPGTSADWQLAVKKGRDAR
jgi:hypothetical protein